MQQEGFSTPMRPPTISSTGTPGGLPTQYLPLAVARIGQLAEGKRPFSFICNGEMLNTLELTDRSLTNALRPVPDLTSVIDHLSLSDRNSLKVENLSKTAGDWELNSIHHNAAEQVVQDAAQKLSAKHKLTVLETFQSDCSPFATKLPTNNNGLAFHKFGSKIDVAGLRFPSGCELKEASNGPLQNSFWEAVVQTLDRLQMISQTCCHLKRFVIFALAPPSCCMFFALSNYEHSQMSWTIHMTTIKPGHLFPLWAILETHAEYHPSWFLHPQAGSLQKLVKELWAPLPPLREPQEVADLPMRFLPMCYFSIQFVMRSSSGTVFLINGPETPQDPIVLGDPNPPKDVCGVFRHNENTLAVKVFETEDDFKREKLSLTGMANLLSSTSEDLKGIRPLDTPFYALATSSGSDDLEWFSTADEQKKRRALPQKSMITNMLNANKKYCRNKGFEMWWGDAEECAPLPILLMEAGEPLELAWKRLAGQKAQVNELVRNTRLGVTTSLNLLHATKRVHRDVRSPNVVLFHGRAQLIDYGFSATFDDQKRAPSAAREIMDKSDFTRVTATWTTTDDHLMFQHLLLHLDTLNQQGISIL